MLRGTFCQLSLRQKTAGDGKETGATVLRGTGPRGAARRQTWAGGWGVWKETDRQSPCSAGTHSKKVGKTKLGSGERSWILGSNAEKKSQVECENKVTKASKGDAAKETSCSGPCLGVPCFIMMLLNLLLTPWPQQKSFQSRPKASEFQCHHATEACPLEREPSLCRRFFSQTRMSDYLLPLLT